MHPSAPCALVADDNPMIRMDAAAILTEAGFRVLTAAGAEDALAVLEADGSRIRLLFTDVQMPPGEMTGFELARRCAEAWPEIGILVASGATPPEPGDLPADAMFIAKPFSEEVVRQHLEEILPRDALPDRSAAHRR